nr:hypothetical protein [Tanacetum cinerariifolium]
ESKDQELEAHYMYMAQIQEVSPDAADSGPIFDVEPLQKVSNDDHYNVFANESEHPEQFESVHDTDSIEQDEHNVIIDSLDMNSLRSQLETQKTQLLNEIGQLSREYYYANHMNAILGVYTEIDEVTNLQCECLENELSKSKMIEVSGYGKFRNDQIAPILGYGDLVQGAVMIKRVYYVEGLNHNLFSIDQFCDADLEVAFRKSTCYICDLKGNDLLTSSRGTDLYSITLQDTTSPILICLMAKATSSQAWLWHHRLSHLNFNTINLLSKNDIVVGLPKLKFVKDHLCSSCELRKSKRKSFQTKITPSSKRRLVQRGLHAQVRIVRTDKGTKFLNKTLHAYFASEGFLHQTSVARTPEQNGVVERRNRTLVEAARTMLSAAKVPLFFWDEVIATTCFTQSHHVSSDPVPSCQRMAFEHDSLSPDPQCQENVTQADRTVTTSNELDLLFSPMFDKLLNGSSQVLSKSFAVTTADAHNQRQQQLTIPLNNQTTTEPICQDLTHAPSVTSNENMNQAEMIAENAQVANDEFINIFCTSVQDRGEMSSRHVDSSNMHTLYQHHPSEHRWTKDHLLEHVIGNPS